MRHPIDEATGLPALPEGMWWHVSKLSKYELKYGSDPNIGRPALFLMTSEETEERYGIFNHNVRIVKAERIVDETLFFETGTITIIRDWRLVKKEHILFAANRILNELQKERNAKRRAEEAADHAEPLFGSYPPKKLGF